jgi:glycosyltransferase involved in cell wall biosynthesis
MAAVGRGRAAPGLTRTFPALRWFVMVSARLPRVLVDCTAIPAKRGGVGRYLEGLISGLSETDVELTLVTQERDRVALQKDAPWAAVTSVPRVLAYRPIRLAWEQLGLPALARRRGVQVLHSPHYTYPVLWRGARVVTVHDATFISHSRLHTPIKRRFFRRWLALAWSNADVVITPSNATATAVRSRLGDPGGAIEVAHLGVDPKRFSPPADSDLAGFRDRFRIAPDEQWFAFLGTIEPRKNLPTLLDAYRQVREALGGRAPRLLISGVRGWDAVAAARLDRLPKNSGVTELGFVKTRELNSLLGGATAVMYPSLGEGFGLPVLEAMACGAAVVTTNHLALPEVGGDAVVYAEPTADALAAAMIRLAQDDELRRDLSARALVQASLFSWGATATAHVRAYRKAQERSETPGARPVRSVHGP